MYAALSIGIDWRHLGRYVPWNDVGNLCSDVVSVFLLNLEDILYEAHPIVNPWFDPITVGILVLEE
jgi:hypothetical protein